jgi:oxygen-independent coproporphyrinogen-3 oxidase
VQKAVHRVQSLESVRDLMLAAREFGFESINADLIYGLPKQTPDSFERTIAQVSELRPDRIALYAYAHLPSASSRSGASTSAELPSAGDRIRMLARRSAGFIGQGYSYIGMDHFALPRRRAGRGQAPGPAAPQLPGLQHAARLRPDRPGRVVHRPHGRHLQPERQDAARVLRRLRQGQLPTVRGLALTRDDLVRRAVIMALMCQGGWSSNRSRWRTWCASRTTSPPSWSPAADADAGLVEIDADGIQVTASGWFFVRGVAMTFDRYLRADQTRERFSRIV